VRFHVALAAVVLVCCGTASAGPIDFAKVDRRIAKEPAYQAKPLYCLALIGPEANVRVWVVVDGERLYVDKNCNGDVSDDGAPTELKDKRVDPASFDKVEVSQDGGTTKYFFGVTLWSRPRFGRTSDEPYHQSVHVHFPDGRYYGAWGDEHSSLIFAETPQNAPVLHYGGDLRMGFEIRQPLARERGVGALKLSVCVGTPGSRPGAFVHLMYNTIPKGLKPQAVLEFPAAEAGRPPIRVELCLKERC
jgi:hypothetical protein